VVLPEVGVPCGDHAAQELTVVRVVQEGDDLLRDGPGTAAAAIGRHDEHEGPGRAQRALEPRAQRDLRRRAVQLLDEAPGVARDAREVHEVRLGRSGPRPRRALPLDLSNPGRHDAPPAFPLPHYMLCHHRAAAAHLVVARNLAEVRQGVFTSSARRTSGTPSLRGYPALELPTAALFSAPIAATQHLRLRPRCPPTLPPTLS